MAVKMGFRLDGVEELVNTMKKLGDPKGHLRIHRSLVGRLGTIAKKEMQKRAPVKSGGLKKSIRVKRRTYGTTATVVVGPDYRKGGPHAHLNEYGTVDRFRKLSLARRIFGINKQTRYTGRMRSKPFLRPAWKAAIPKMNAKARSFLEKAIEREVKKAAK